MSLLRSSLHLTILSTLVVAAFGCSAAATGGDEGASSSEAISTLPSNAHASFQYFVGKGLTRIQSAAIVGNLIQESSVDPTIHELGGGPGRGIAQWSSGGRWNASSHDNVVWYASTHGGSERSCARKAGRLARAPFEDHPQPFGDSAGDTVGDFLRYR